MTTQTDNSAGERTQDQDLLANILRNAQDAKRFILTGNADGMGDDTVLECLESIEVEVGQLTALRDHSHIPHLLDMIEQRNLLLMACKGLIDGPGDGFGHHSKAEMECARAAIARAEGPRYIPHSCPRCGDPMGQAEAGAVVQCSHCEYDYKVGDKPLRSSFTCRE